MRKFEVGQKIYFAEEKRPYTIQACDERYLICTKPFNLKHTILYTIVDLKEGIRGADNYWKWGGYFDYSDRKECEEAIRSLNSENSEYDLGERGGLEISFRNRIPLRIDHKV